jgi:hypothetical protein
MAAQIGMLTRWIGTVRNVNTASRSRRSTVCVTTLAAAESHAVCGYPQSQDRSLRKHACGCGIACDLRLAAGPQSA